MPLSGMEILLQKYTIIGVFMIIININSRFDLSPDQISFIEDVFSRDRYYEQTPNRLSELSQTIPVYLVDEVKFNNIRHGIFKDDNDDRHDRDYRDDRPHNDDRNDNNSDSNDDRNNDGEFRSTPDTEVLGYYLSKGVHGNQEIYICTDTIFRHSMNNDELKFLLAKVIVHEFAHAYMDYRHRRYNKTDEFYSWMEESFANEITLYHFRDYERIPYHRKYKRRYLSHNPIPSPFDYVKEFIKRQPNHYKLGLDLFENRIRCFDIWARNKCEVEQKTTAKKEWLDYVKANVRSSTFDRDILRELTINVIRQDHYSEVKQK